MPDFSLEMQIKGAVAGIDEAGRGPWAGPVVAGAVIFPPGSIPPSGLDDSKKLSAATREALFNILKENVHTGIGIASVEDIDRLNILGATKLAMQRAFAQLAHLAPVAALVDGNQPPALPCEVYPVVKGDARSFSIAAASVIAKVTRDRIMQELAAQYPAYGWERNAGYGTPAHQRALALYGVTPHHRRSFAPIRKRLEEGFPASVPA